MTGKAVGIVATNESWLICGPPRLRVHDAAGNVRIVFGEMLLHALALVHTISCIDERAAYQTFRGARLSTCRPHRPQRVLGVIWSDRAARSTARAAVSASDAASLGARAGLFSPTAPSVSDSSSESESLPFPFPCSRISWRLTSSRRCRAAILAAALAKGAPPELQGARCSRLGSSVCRATRSPVASYL